MNRHMLKVMWLTFWVTLLKQAERASFTGLPECPSPMILSSGEREIKIN